MSTARCLFLILVGLSLALFGIVDAVDGVISSTSRYTNSEEFYLDSNPGMFFFHLSFYLIVGLGAAAYGYYRYHKVE